MLTYDFDEDNFFDSNEYIDASVDFFLSEDNFEKEEVEFSEYGYEIWTRELMSIAQRRKKFLGEMGFHELIRSPADCSEVSNLLEKEMSLERIMEGSGAELDSLSSLETKDPENFLTRARDLDNGRRIVVHDTKQDGIPGGPNKSGYSQSLSLHEFELLLGLNPSVQKIVEGQCFSHVQRPSICLKEKETRLLRWWRSFKHQTKASRSFRYEPSEKESQLPRLMKRKLQKQSRSCKEITALYAGQEIKGHKGLIRTMKFSPSGRYLASGGEDCVVLIWQISELETCSSCFLEASTKLSSDIQETKLWNSSSGNSTPILIPQRFSKIDETPLQALVGHTSDILDLSWSNSNMLLTSSKDKTVRMWKVGHDGCLKVFQHSDFVTCVQFNPIDSRYFISGSIDGKVRIWGVTDSRVADWVDTRDIVTSLCHYPDRKGFVVGSVSGNCLYYDYSDGSLQLSTQLFDQGKRKSSAKSITGLQCFPENSRWTVVTSADSRIQILDGTDAVLKLKGQRRVKNQCCASITSDGKHIISVGDDSHVYIWNYDESNQTPFKVAKSVHFCESFLSEGASVAVPWHGMSREQAVLVGHDDPVSLSPTNSPRDPGYLSHGGWLFSDVSSRISATWPEENLPSTTESPSNARNCNNFHHHHPDESYPSVKSVALSWNRVILTGGIDGTIKTFYYCGCKLGCK